MVKWQGNINTVYLIKLFDNYVMNTVQRKFEDEAPCPRLVQLWNRCIQFDRTLLKNNSDTMTVKIISFGS